MSIDFQEPRYAHEDCKSCIFLGSFHEYDLYVCVSAPTIIARFGDAGEYISGLEMAMSGTHPALREGYLRATRSHILPT